MFSLVVVGFGSEALSLGRSYWAGFDGDGSDLCGNFLDDGVSVGRSLGSTWEFPWLRVSEIPIPFGVIPKIGADL